MGGRKTSTNRAKKYWWAWNADSNVEDYWWGSCGETHNDCHSLLLV